MIPLQLDRSAPTTLQSQIYNQIRRLIVDGVISPGVVIPSTRALSKQYTVARNTVLIAYDWLLSEGYVETKPGLGTHVSWRLPETCLRIGEGKSTDEPSEKSTVGAKPQPVWNTPDLKLPETDDKTSKIDFAPGKINPKHFPEKLVRRFGNNALRNANSYLTRYCNLTGLPSLKDAIADHLSMSRGMRANSEQIIITSGIQEALNIISRMFVSKGTEVAVENPCYQGACLTFGSYGATLLPIDVDNEGIIVDQLYNCNAKLLYLTPSHQFPIGATLAQTRRHDVLNWALAKGAYIVEDDYDSDYRYDSPPLTSLAGSDRSDSVIYLGTLSKSLGPGFRVGYLIVPQTLVDSATSIKTMSTLGNQYIEQKIISDFFSTGAYHRHLRRIRKYYLDTRDALLAQLEKRFGDITVIGKDSGMHLAWIMPDRFPASARVSEKVRQFNVSIHTVESAGAIDYGSIYRDNTLIFGYSSLAPKQVTKGIDILFNSLQND